MGVKFVSVKGDDAVSIIALNPEAHEDEVIDAASEGSVDATEADAPGSQEDHSEAPHGTVGDDTEGVEDVVTGEDDGE
jgi:DNA gyrase subunit A